MSIEFTRQESSILYELLAEGTTDIILKTDRDGFIRHASPAIEQLGFVLPDMLVWPHILDLVDSSFEPAIRAAHQAAVDGCQPGRWIEFSSAASDGRERWFAIQMRSLVDDRNGIYGALSVIRNVAETRELRDRLFAAELTDPLTRLTNRQAFIAMLQYLVDCRAGGWLALFDIDYFKAINMRYGHSAGDQLLVAFADFLRSLADPGVIISRVGCEKFAALLPEATQDQARALSQEIVDTLAELGHSGGPDGLPITATASVVRIDRSIDTTIRSAELAMIAAKAKGRSCIEMVAGR